MTISLEKIQEMWKKDSVIDIDNLHTESLNVPVLHAKYYNIYNLVTELKSRAEKQKNIIRNKKYEYYSGKADPEVYQENPLPKKVRDKEAMQNYLNADGELSKASYSVDYCNSMLKYLDDILKMIHNRTYHIKHSIDFMKFQSGMGG